MTVITAVMMPTESNCARANSRYSAIPSEIPKKESAVSPKNAAIETYGESA